MKIQRRGFLQQSAGLAALAAWRPVLGAEEMPAGPKFVDVDGIRTRYFEAGSGEAMVLVHGGQWGGGGSADGYAPVFGKLSQRFHVYAFDKLGMGQTDVPKRDEDYTMAGVTRHALRFVEKMGIQRMHLAGHSRGALPVARIAVERPELVSNLIIFDSNTLAPDDPSTPVPPDPTEEPRVPAEILEKTKATLERLKYLRDRFVEQNPERVKANPALGKIMAPTPWWMYDFKYETLDWIKQGKLKSPTLIIWGFNDPGAPFKLGVNLFELICSAVPRAQFHVFNKTGHSPYGEHPDEVIDLLLSFIRSSTEGAKP
ncbi:MAG: alpha/beta hydrolase [Acidobacteria bacterium]|nr:alpha/beta hydrolase [Acidobacteriota bacterium]